VSYRRILIARDRGGGSQVRRSSSWHGLKVRGASAPTSQELPLERLGRLSDVGLHCYVSIKGAHLPMSPLPMRETVAQKFRDAGITPMSCGSVAMRRTTRANIAPRLRPGYPVYLPTIVCAPFIARTRCPSLGMVKEFTLASRPSRSHILARRDEGFPRPRHPGARSREVWKAVRHMIKRIGLCV